MNIEIINNLPSAICSVTLNNEYKKLVSETITLEEKTDIGRFEFMVEYPKETYTVFILKTIFKEDEGPHRVLYHIADDNTIELIAYNITKDVVTSHTIFCNMQKIIGVDDKEFYVKPKIIVSNNGVKEVTIDLFLK